MVTIQPIGSKIVQSYEAGIAQNVVAIRLPNVLIVTQTFEVITMCGVS